MTAGELKEALEGVPDERPVRLLGDPEGNMRWGAGDVFTEQHWNFENEESVHPVDVKEGFHGPNASIEDFDKAVLIAPKHL